MRTRSMAARSRATPARATGRDLRSKRANLKRKQLPSVPEVPQIPKWKALELPMAEKKAPEIPIPDKKAPEIPTLYEASQILKLKKEAFEVIRLWREVDDPDAVERWVKAKEEEAKAEAAQPKRRMVRRTKVSEERITLMKLHPYRNSIEDLSADVLANGGEDLRRMHAMRTFINSKMRAYEEALIMQHDSTKGYAEDETEVTDEDEE